ncbi:MAG TPA: zinc-ribbon domain-containing protein [Euryarchaeota archaeon]|nr:MAG: DNA-directed RNA polymerase subunit P [Thermococci archaeon]RLF97099.1 MAG: DNA-directed RNA polymerase subunit P [Thermococci archaeon]HDI10212.1 zinc-ribbon domain-containing protein [Euryarchaeota archaeon]
MRYRCGKCGKEVELEETFGIIRCSNCGYRIFYKERAPVIKRVKAR